jgi:endonuclease/exonuclease/phosphatase family metal-dependent hydrolase
MTQLPKAILAFIPILVALGCSPEVALDDGAAAESDGDDSKADLVDYDLPVPERPSEASPAEPAHSLDLPETVDVGSWNVAWLGSFGGGPDDEGLQLANVADVLYDLDLDLVGLVEVASEGSFAELMESLPGVHGLLVTDPVVEGGGDSYGDREQKVALLMKDRFTVTRARVILAEDSWAFGGRPPMEVSLSFTEDGRPRTLDVVVAHFKAMVDADAYERRARASVALESGLAAEHPRDWVLVVGDFNDDLDASTYRRRTSPFANFVGDPAYVFTTQALSDAGISTTVYWSSTIDHHLATASLARRFVEGSAEVLRPDEWIAEYGETTSDHYPVLTRYDLQ